MARNSKPEKWFWPLFDTRPKAESAMMGGAYVSWFVAVVTTCTATFALIFERGSPAAYGLIDGALFALIGWRIWRYSLLAAVAGFALFSLEKILQFATQPNAILGVALAVLVWCGFLNSLRAAIALRELDRQATARQAGLPEAALPDADPAADRSTS